MDLGPEVAELNERLSVSRYTLSRVSDWMLNLGTQKPTRKLPNIRLGLQIKPSVQRLIPLSCSSKTKTAPD